MRILLTALVFISISIQPASAQDVAITIDGEPFTKEYRVNASNGDKLREFVRTNENFENWTRLIGIRYEQYPSLANDPIKVAASREKNLKANNPQASSRVEVNKQANEAMHVFIIPTQTHAVEFNVFRFAKSLDGNAVVSLQFTYRLDESSPKAFKIFQEHIQSWINQIGFVNMNDVRSILVQ